MRKQHLKLTDSEHSYLTTLITLDELKTQKMKWAMTLLLLDQGKTLSGVFRTIEISETRKIRANSFTP